MKMKKAICLLLVFCMVFSLFAACKPHGGQEETKEGEHAGGPFRPADPGVIAPLAMESALPEDGIVWNMENIPDNLIDAGWASSMWMDHDDYVEKNVEFLGVNGRGYDGSRALALRQNGKYVWCDIYNIGMKMDDTAITNWSGGDIFWFWYDSTDIPNNMLVELELNGAHIATGTKYYTLPEGQTVAKKAGSTPEAWNGAGYGRIPVSGGSRGWVGVPLSGYNVGLRKIVSFTMHVGYSGEAPVGKCLYIDNFCVTFGGVGPMGAELSDISALLATSDKAAWDMENIPQDLISSNWASIQGVGWDGYTAGNIRVLGANGRGVNGSRALQIKQVGEYCGADVVDLGITNDKTAFSDWSEGQFLWFWVDTTALRNDLRLDLYIDGKQPAIGTPYYGINGSMQTQQAGSFTRAWDGATYGRMTVGANYRGWVGVPLSAYGTVTEVMNITLHMAYDGGASNTGRSVYFDEFWVLKQGELPKDATSASIFVLRGGNNGVNLNIGSTAKLPCEVWSMNNLPANPVGSDWIYAEYATDPSFNKNNVTFRRADGKGYKGSAALQIKQNGAYAWSDIYNIDLSKDSSTVRNWSNGKLLWFYVDATEHDCGVRLDFSFDGNTPKINGTYYLITDGDNSSTTQTIKPAWDGATYGRISLSTGFKGWVGIPLDQFTKKLTSGTVFQLHVAYGGESIKGKSTYIDSLWLTDNLVCPNGVKVTVLDNTDSKATSGEAAWDMENLPNNLLASGWVVCDFAGDNAYIPDNLQYFGVDGKGRDDSRAMQIKFNGEYSWADQYTLGLKNDPDADTDWTGGEMLWLWVNGSELAADLEMEVWLGTTKINKSAGYYVIKDGKAVKGGSLIVAWDGFGRIPVKAGYMGFIGVPLSGYGTVKTVRNITLHFAGNGVSKNKCLYLDELWITGADEIPVNAKDGYFYEDKPSQELDLPLVVWDMEALPDDVNASIAEAKFPTHAEYIKGNVTATGENAKGYSGSRALAIHQNGNYSWADIYDYYLNKDRTAITTWSGADMLWMWVDASEFTVGITMDFYVDGRYVVNNEYYYTVNGSVAEPKGRTFLSWDGATNARFRIEAGFCGWIGLPFTAFNRAPSSASNIEIHCGFDGNTGYQGKTLYIDQLTLTDLKTGPENSQILVPSSGDTILATSNKAAWDMENIPDNLVTSGWASNDWTSHADYKQDNVTVLGADGKGRKNTRALQIKQNGKYLWCDEFTVDLANDTTFANDWRNGDMMMLWVDTTDFPSDTLRMDFIINGQKPATGSSCFMEQNGVLTKAGTLDAAYDGADFGRLTLPNKFKGWIALPLSAYGGIRVVETIKLHISYETNKSIVGHSLYLDDLWIISGNNMPSQTVSDNTGDDGDITTILNTETPISPSSYLNTDVGTTFQTVKAYGISDCWWTNAIGTLDSVNEIQRMFFTDDGIALNNYRINVGAGVLNSRADSPTYEQQWRAVYSPMTETGSLDITRNAGGWNALNALRALISSGKAQVDDFTLFMNSPPSTMTDNGLTFNNNHLKEDCYDDYAKYVADVVELYQLNGVQVKYVSPINEPTNPGWTVNAGQESCVYTVDQIVRIYELVIDELDARGLSTKLSVAEFATWNAAATYFSAIMASEKIASHIDHYTGHDYGGSASTKASMYQTASAAGLPLHMSEWAMAINDKADNMETALMLAKMLQEDLTTLNVDTWSWWTGVAHGAYTDGLIYVTDGSVYELTKRFWAYGNYSKFTKGYTRVDVNGSMLADGLSASAFKHEKDGKTSLVYVLLNENDTDTVMSFAGMPDGAKANVYVTSDAYDCKQIGYVSADSGVTLGAMSVTTFIFNDIDAAEIDKDAVPEVKLPLHITAMDSLPDDLFVAGLASSQFEGNVGAVSAKGKGFNGTDALGYVYKNIDGSNYWGNYLELKTDNSMQTNWGAAELLWFWVDTSEFTSQIKLDLWLNDCKPATGAQWYTWDAKAAAAQSAGALPEAWNGAGYGRIPLAQGYTGFVGIPLSAFDGLTKNNIEKLYFYFECENDATELPRTLYIDELWATEANGLPKVTAIVMPSGVNKVVWDMENLPTTLSTDILTAWGKGTLGQYVDATVAEGKGFDGSTALGYKYLQFLDGANGENTLQIKLDGGLGSNNNWTGAGTIWFWIDASEMTSTLLLEVMLDWIRPTIGSNCYFWDGKNAATTSTLPAAWGGNTTEGRVQLTAGYKGWVGIPTAAYDGLDLAKVGELVLYFEPKNDASSLPKTVYFDNFWITAAGETPNCKGTSGGEIKPPAPQTDKGKAIWTMENLPSDLTGSIVTCWGRGNLGDYVDAVAATGKGYNGSTALGYKYLQYVPGANGDNVLQIMLGSSIGAQSDWSGKSLLWFWVDTSEMTTPLLLEVMLNWARPAINSKYYLWDGTNAPDEKTMPAAWGDNTTDGRIQLTAGYKGWIGVPLNAYPGLNLSNVDTMILYFEPREDGAALPKTVYFDNFWLTNADCTPDLTEVKSAKAAPVSEPSETEPVETTEPATQDALPPEPVSELTPPVEPTPEPTPSTEPSGNKNGKSSGEQEGDAEETPVLPIESEKSE